ncbi:MAG TPA: SDR family oxidoreductase [Methylococcaceae bacterium]|nr:SDR family oxidoreductase [Methylococcaceae bacterium]
MPHIENQVAIVTGSTAGIGRGIAERLAAQGVAVVVTGRQESRAGQVAAEIESRGGTAAGFAFDLEDNDSLETLIDRTVATFGRLDILVNNARSVASALPLESLTKAQMRAAFSANIDNVFLLTLAAHPHLKATKGTVINIGSVVVHRHLLGLPIYTIIKGALLQMTKALAAEWAGDGIRVNAVNPGFTRTDFFSELGVSREEADRILEFYRRYVPLGEIGKPGDIGGLVAWLASDAARFLTGAVIDADAGYSVRGLPMYGAA